MECPGNTELGVPSGFRHGSIEIRALIVAICSLLQSADASDHPRILNPRQRWVANGPPVEDILGTPDVLLMPLSSDSWSGVMRRP